MQISSGTTLSPRVNRVGKTTLSVLSLAISVSIVKPTVGLAETEIEGIKRFLDGRFSYRLSSSKPQDGGSPRGQLLGDLQKFRERGHRCIQKNECDSIQTDGPLLRKRLIETLDEIAPDTKLAERQNAIGLELGYLKTIRNQTPLLNKDEGQDARDRLLKVTSDDLSALSAAMEAAFGARSWSVFKSQIRSDFDQLLKNLAIIEAAEMKTGEAYDWGRRTYTLLRALERDGLMLTVYLDWYSNSMTPDEFIKRFTALRFGNPQTIDIESSCRDRKGRLQYSRTAFNTLFGVTQGHPLSIICGTGFSFNEVEYSSAYHQLTVTNPIGLFHAWDTGAYRAIGELSRMRPDYDLVFKTED